MPPPGLVVHFLGKWYLFDLFRIGLCVCVQHKRVHRLSGPASETWGFMTAARMPQALVGTQKKNAYLDPHRQPFVIHVASLELAGSHP